MVIANLVGGGWTSVAAKRCDNCKTAAAAAFCRVDSAFLCLNCDSKIHGVNSPLTSRHERVWMCEVCEQAPAAVTCRADAAALCVACDADIHSANSLARRHERVPVEPFYDSAESIVTMKSSPFSFLTPSSESNGGLSSEYGQADGVLEAGGVSWLLPNPHDQLNSKLSLENHPDVKSGDLFFADIDSFLEFDYKNSMNDGRFDHRQNNSVCADSVVPVQAKAFVGTINPVINSGSNCFDIDFCRSKLSSFSYPTQSLSQSVSSSSLDVGVVPEGSAMSDMSYPFGRNTSDGSDPSVPMSAGGAKNQQAAQLCGIDREARVLRYRERRKNRKFEKTIRYASRKAYAETRPRIKGRFAKRAEVDSDIDHLYDSSPVPFMSEIQYGVVPSF